jgi:hypothetical protein
MVDGAMEPVLAVILASVAIGLLAWRRRRQPTAALAGWAQGVHTGQLMLALVRQLQQHRGLSAAQGAGEPGLAPALALRRDEVGRLLACLEGALAHGGPSAQEFTAFRRHWQTLVDGAPGRSADDALARHDFLVATVLDWLGALGRRHLAAGHDGRLTACAHDFCQRLPAAAEALGQARAIGTTVVARQGCSPAARVRLLFLMARAESLVAQAAGDADDPCMRAVAVQARRAVAEMARVVRAQMLMRSGVCIGAEAYFALATRAIDALFDWIELCARELRSSRPQAVPGGVVGEAA